MPSNFPGTLDTFPNPGPTTRRNDPGFEEDIVISNLGDALEAVEAKLGLGASTPAAAAAVLRRTASGASAWGPAQAGDLLGGGVANRGLVTVDGTTAVWAQIVAAMLAGGGTANRVLATTDGSNVAMQTLTTPMLAANAASLQANSATFSATGAPSSLSIINGTTGWAQLVGMVGGYVLVFFWGYVSNTINGAVTYLNIGLDGAASPLTLSVAIQNNAGYSTPFCVVAGTTPAAGTHTFYGLYQVGSGSATVNGQMAACEFRR